MGKKGLLQQKNFGYSMPVSDPAYGRPPFIYRTVDFHCINFETNYESAGQMLPEPLEFADETPTASLMLSNIKMSNFGPYGEAILGLHASYRGKRFIYLPNLLVTQEDPLMGGREIWGYAKKTAKIEFTHERNQITAFVERPTGNRLVTATVSPQVNLKKEDWINTDILSLKLIPSAEEGKGPDVCQLVGCKYELFPFVGSDGICELWSGVGSVTWGSRSNDDAWHRVTVEKITGAIYGRFTINLPYGYIVHDYLK